MANRQQLKLGDEFKLAPSFRKDGAGNTGFSQRSSSKFFIRVPKQPKAIHLHNTEHDTKRYLETAPRWSSRKSPVRGTSAVLCSANSQMFCFGSGTTVISTYSLFYLHFNRGRKGVLRWHERTDYELVCEVPALWRAASQ